MVGSERQTIELTQIFLIKLAPDPISLDKAKCENDEIVKINS